MKTIIALIFLALTTAAQAQVNVDLISVAGENALTKEESLQSFEVMKQKYADETGVDLQLVAFRRVGNPFKNVRKLEQRFILLDKWKGYFARHSKQKTTIHVAQTPPLISRENGKKVYWIAGVADTGCSRKKFGVAYAVGEMKNADGLARFIHSVYGLMHEVGHLLGADHDDELPGTIMNSAPLIYVGADGQLHFSQKSINQIRRCVGL